MDCIGKFVEIRPVYNEINEIKEYRCEVCRRILLMRKEDFERSFHDALVVSHDRQVPPPKGRGL